MKPYRILWMLTVALLLSFGMKAQSYNLNNEASNLIIEGTSNIHDWTIKAKNKEGILITDFDNGQLKGIEKLEFTVKAKSLMSGKSGMDKNTYAALNTDVYKDITYKLKKVNEINQISGDDFEVKTTGSLMIAGTTKDINLNFKLKNSNNELVLTGEHKINMTNFGVEAPTAMFGTIKTGKDVVVKFESYFKI